MMLACTSPVCHAHRAFPGAAPSPRVAYWAISTSSSGTAPFFFFMMLYVYALQIALQTARARVRATRSCERPRARCADDNSLARPLKRARRAGAATAAQRASPPPASPHTPLRHTPLRCRMGVAFARSSCIRCSVRVESRSSCT
eukprot:5816711-Prymnesium_polylepis.1